ncbi:hypothetical protein FGG08_004046 [Glutinoglossum americanum]|uniref:Uncharacterized protein n=1 Tax=Glutinoglossum americanum TaxID=1670608 RepID=A0A9P8L004_9PEZI|nr:hypothetical protein FGG08_004046 [Glutinoglossum americanum]
MPSVSPAVDYGGPVAKRQKTANDTTVPGSVVQESRIFTPFRTIGLISPTSVPFSSVPLGKTTFQITTSVGRCLQTYDLRRGLNLVFLTRPQTEGDITAVTSWKDKVFAAWSSGAKIGISVFKRGKQIDELETPDDLDEPVHQLLIFGSWIVGCCSAKIVVWRSANYEYYTTLAPPRSGRRDTGTILSGGISSMPTFLNKIFAGRGDGGVEIWNVSTGKLVYTILPPSPDCGGVTALQQAPALSLLAIAYANGLLIIHDIRTDETVIQLNSGQKSRVDSISFRTDGLGAGDDGRRAGVMATAGADSGDVTLWDLNNGGRVVGILRGAHNPPSAIGGRVSGGVNKVEFLPGQPIIVTSGLDNAIKSWRFDESPYSAIPHILHSRSGHAAPVRNLHFLPVNSDGADDGGKWLLSAGGDRSLWAWSLRKDGQSTEMSQGHIKKRAKKLGILGADSSSTATLEDLKAPEITCIATSLNRDGGMGTKANSGGAVWANKTGGGSSGAAGDTSGSATTGWESVITGHKGDRFARTWFWGKKKAGRWALETGDGGEVKSVAISPCGTFALVGSSLGSINMFNLQSGLPRQRFPAKLTPAQARRAKLGKASDTVVDLSRSLKKFGLGEGKHTDSVSGLAVDGLNRVVISCGLDGKLKFWDFAAGLLIDEMDWSSITSIKGLRYHRPSDLIALSCGDLSIRVVDVETKKVIRELRGCGQEINDFCFSNDGRWIIAASADSVVRVWDLPTGHLIDAIRLQSACTALAFSETGEFLATAHAEGVGVNIWNNRTLFTHVPTRHITEAEIVEVAAPVVSGEGGQDLINAAFGEEADRESRVEDVTASNVEQLSKDIVTLSLVPKSRWQTLLHLDLIKQRNKPKEPPKAPEKAPFFLSLSGSTPADENAAGKALQISAAEKSRIMKMDRLGSESEFTVLLRENSRTRDSNLSVAHPGTPFLAHLKSLPPSTTDLEIRSLGPLKPYTELTHFVLALTSRLREKQDYELVQAWMRVFLRVHGGSIGVATTEEGGEELVGVLREWRAEQEREAGRLGELVGSCAGMVGFLRGR